MALPVFPALSVIIGREFPVGRSTKWNGESQEALSGKRVRTSYESYPTYVYELSFSVLRTAAAFAEYQAMQVFINIVLGGAGLFLFDDVNDDTATASSIGLADGTSTTFQLTRTMNGFGGQTFTEPVFFPNVITNVTINGTPTGAYTLSSTGQVIFNSPPGLGALLAWTGTFYWGCRFDNDSFDFSNFLSQIFELKKLSFSTEKLT